MSLITIKRVIGYHGTVCRLTVKRNFVSQRECASVLEHELCIVVFVCLFFYCLFFLLRCCGFLLRIKMYIQSVRMVRWVESGALPVLWGVQIPLRRPRERLLWRHCVVRAAVCRPLAIPAFVQSLCRLGRIQSAQYVCCLFCSAMRPDSSGVVDLS